MLFATFLQAAFLYKRGGEGGCASFWLDPARASQPYLHREPPHCSAILWWGCPALRPSRWCANLKGRLLSLLVSSMGAEGDGRARR